MHNSILQIYNESKTCLGTGFVIDKDSDGVFVATCGHVVNDCGETIQVAGKKAKIIENKYDDGLDLAILYVEGINAAPFIISDDKLSEKVKVIGYSKLLDDPKREEINDISIKFDIEITKEDDIKISAIKLYPKEPISKGYSGSPVICEKSGNVIGIVNIQVGIDTNYAISAKHLLSIYIIKNTHTLSPSLKTSMKKSLVTKLKKEECILIKKQFEENLEKSLQSFSTQQKVWIEPKLHTKEENSKSVTDEDNINLGDIIANPKSYVIKARQQFGLTCLAHYLVNAAWTDTAPSFWLYLDSNELKPYTKEIEKYVGKKLKSLGLSISDIECVVLDEFSSSVKKASVLIGKLSDYFIDLPLIIMMTKVENSLLNESTRLPDNRQFEIIYLWALDRHDVRRVVCDYNNEKYIGDENSVVNKIVSDLDVLNMPRTALNCLTILKIYEAEFDDSPVNRTEMIRRVLFLLFNIDDIPRYKSRPDLKDTEYVLGYFCELMLKSNEYYFTRESFLEELNKFCKDSEIDLDTDVIFDVLFTNNIIVMRGHEFCFKFSYWVFYFAAHRMHHSAEFSKYILSDMNYASYPELIEFYAGIDRRRDDVLNVLIKDMEDIRNVVKEKCGLPDDFNIYDMAQWNPSENNISEMRSELTSGALSSNLPDFVKDQYADKSYDRARPLTQTIHSILEEYSLLRLMKTVHAGSTALRNSDYSDPAIRHQLLDQILCSWDQITKVLLILAPVLTEKGIVTLEGASFVLDYVDDESSREEKFNDIIQSLPANVVSWYKDDFFSKKMGSLLFKHINKETNKLKIHTLNLLIIHKRPKGWDSYIEKYILNENKNSYYLCDVYSTLRAEYQFSFASSTTLDALAKLIKMSAAKHDLGIKKPGAKTLGKISNDVLPTRNI